MKTTIAFALLCSISIFIYAGNIYQCTDESGNTTFTDRPCPTQNEIIIEQRSPSTAKTEDNQIIATENEIEAFRESTSIVMEDSVARLVGDVEMTDNYIPLASQGCLVSTNSTVPEGTVRYFSGVASECVVMDPSEPQHFRMHMFVPVRLVGLCKASGVTLADCDIQ